MVWYGSKVAFGPVCRCRCRCCQHQHQHHYHYHRRYFDHFRGHHYYYYTHLYSNSTIPFLPLSRSYRSQTILDGNRGEVGLLSFDHVCVVYINVSQFAPPSTPEVWHGRAYIRYPHVCSPIDYIAAPFHTRIPSSPTTHLLSTISSTFSFTPTLPFISLRSLSTTFFLVKPPCITSSATFSSRGNPN